MKSWKLTPFIILILTFLLFFSISCSCEEDENDINCPTANDDDSADDDDDDDAIDDDDNDTEDFCDQFDDPTQAGRDYLLAGIPEMARQAFECSLELDETDSDAHYGLMLSGGLHLYELISLVSVMINNFEDGHQPVKEIDPFREMLRQILAILTEGIIHPAGDNIRKHSDWLTENGDPVFEIDGIPILWELRPVASLGSEFDVSEKEACIMIGGVFDGIGGTLISLKLDTDLSVLLNLDFSGDIMELISRIVYLIDGILNDPGFPETLLIDPDYMDRVAESRQYIGIGFLALQNTLSAIMSETDPQQDDVLAYIDENQNGAYDTGEPLAIPGLDPWVEDDLALALAVGIVAEDLGAAFLDRTDLDVDPAQDNPFHLSTLNEVLKAFGIPGIIPGFITIDIAEYYEDLQPESIRNFLQALVNILKIFFPPPAAA